MGDMEKGFGKGAVMRWGEKVSNTSVSVIPTGCLGLDMALGIGGIPRGRIIEIFGPESSGKTTVTLHIVAEVQKMRGVAAFIDAEHALDPVYARKLGVNIDDLYISQPDSGEQALDIAEEMVKSGAIDLIVIDSVAALVPRSELEGDMGHATMGVQARLMSQALRKLTAICGRTGTTIIFTNQLRANIGGYGLAEVTTGGRALKFYASIRMEIRKQGDSIKEGEKLIGNPTFVKVAKNKLAPPFKTVNFDIMFGKGISYEGDVLDVAVASGIINKGGSWYSYQDYSWQGREKAKAFFKENPELCVELENAVRAKNDMKTLTEIRNAPLRELITIESKPKKEKGRSKSGKTEAQIVEINDDADGFDGAFED
ncbi:MAG: recombinase RecA [Defluviitaleaceae bacterium]|nr:recombinase RecA [Defluviitaleaceae bacterium]MCL2837163.1 recombinase RecA [Defluviitaleaceae bacterium]